MDRKIVRKLVIKTIIQLLILIFMTILGLIGITYILEPDSVLAFFKN